MKSLQPIFAVLVSTFLFVYKATNLTILQRKMLLLVHVATIVNLFANIPKIVQDQAYHRFADARCACCIPNASNVVSNVGFLVVGIWGLVESIHQHIAWQVFFTGVILVSIGSAYYHWSPSNQTLIWDRLPMTVGFTGVLTVAMNDYIPDCLWMLFPFVLIGMTSMIVWHQTEDLRMYLFVQLYPVLLILMLHFSLESRYNNSHHYVNAVALFLLAKIPEYYDRLVYNLTCHMISGHTIKHFVATVAVMELVMMLRDRDEIAK